MKKVFAKDEPSKALQYFQVKMTFTTGPVELNRAINQKKDILVVDVRAAEDFSQVTSAGQSVCLRTNGTARLAYAKIN